MSHPPYPYKRAHAFRYLFTSTGKTQLEKAVDFVPTGIKNIVNLGFGDLRPDDSIDYTSVSNNGDITKVLATVVGILKDYTIEFPEAEIFFTGSTPERTRLYTRILKTYYAFFRENFTISAITVIQGKNKRVPFNPETKIEYLAFLIKRIN